MAFHCDHLLIPNTRLNTHCHVRPVASYQTSTKPPEARRSANYRPNVWDPKFVQSLTSDFKSPIYSTRIEKLKEDVRGMFDEASGSTSLLKFIDTIQRLGLDYHFHDEIRIFIGYKDDWSIRAPRFRLLRQHGYEVCQDVFKRFKEESYRNQCMDVEGMLNLYEASFYACEGEEILNQIQEFTSRHLKDYMKGGNDDEIHSTSKHIKDEISHSLELPLLWRVPRMEVRWCIEMYQMKQDMTPSLLEFAKLDFNMVQATYQQELKYASRWGRDLGLDETLSFARNRLAECFLWYTGLWSEPKFGNVRRQLTKVGYLVTVIDDAYDVYGSLEELKLFTEAVERWDINTIESLPQYMKICFFALYNTVNEMAFEVLKRDALDVLPCLKKTWAEFCKALLVEATWYYGEYTPTLEEYTKNGSISVAGPLVSLHGHCLSGDIEKEALECMDNKQHTDLTYWASVIFRLANDLGTSKDEQERGDAPTSIQCCMHQTGVSESTAREHIRYLISLSWKKMNNILSSRSGYLPSSFINTAQNLARTSLFMYQHGDGFSIPDRETKDRIASIIVEPIPVRGIERSDTKCIF
ncbi:hypothetical protein MKW98_011622 [Papaver atlanticum]|uniref:Uncharacterized protein n=1 Tax=Papaver atlanticum TaxID=357466 RepID=A0AAD4S863_9MAGN|nr:hypothetical protein MKW98_011622 [Papaver atlanticum]